MNNTQSFEDWSESLENMDFAQYSLAIKEKIMQGNFKDFDEKLKGIFNDSYEYVMKLHKSNKPLDIKLLKIHLEDVKGHTNITFDTFVKISILLSYCGFNLSYNK